MGAADVEDVRCIFGNLTTAARKFRADGVRRILAAQCEVRGARRAAHERRARAVHGDSSSRMPRAAPPNTAQVPPVSASLWLEARDATVELSLQVAERGGAQRLARGAPPLRFEFLYRFGSRPATADLVPNVVHAVFVGGSPFPGYACLSLLTAALVWNPDEIVLHVDVLPVADEAWACARALARVRVHGPTSRASIAAMPKVRRISRLLPQHRSDLIRAQILLDDGGVYLDSDTYAMAALGTLRRHPFTIAYEGSRWSSGKLNNGLMLSAPRARFAALLRDSYSDWDGSGWDTQSCRRPFEIALQHPALVNVENYPERSWPSGALRPPRVGIFGGRTETEGRNLSAGFDGCVALHLSGMGSKHNTAKNRDRKTRGYLHFMLANALARMAGPPRAIRALAARAADAAGADAASALCGCVTFVRAWLRKHKDVAPPRRHLPAPSPFAPAECALDDRSRPPTL
jgi:hypothetical protein